MAINVDVKRKKKDSNASIMRTFSKKVKQSGILRKKRSLRFFERKISDYKKKMNALMRLQKQKAYEKALKMGTLKINKR